MRPDIICLRKRLRQNKRPLQGAFLSFLKGRAGDVVANFICDRDCDGLSVCWRIRFDADEIS